MNIKILIGVILIVVISVAFVTILMFNNFGSYQLIIQYPDANGLKSGDLVYSKGVEIGAVKKIILVNNSVEVVTQIYNIYKKKIPIDSKFYIKKDLLTISNKCIDIDIGKSMIFLRDKDMIKGIAFNWLKQVTNKINSFFKSDSWNHVVSESKQIFEENKESCNDEFSETFEKIKINTKEYYEKLKVEMPEMADSFMIQMKEIFEEYNNME